MGDITRRQFLSASAAVAGAVLLPACADRTERVSGANPSRKYVLRPTGLGDPGDAPFDTVVVLMMENRSFDHLLGWLPGADGKQAGLEYLNRFGRARPTWPIAPDWQGWHFADPAHDWASAAEQWNNGACDGFITDEGGDDPFPISYYTGEDLPVLATLAGNYTTFDRYFCSLLGPTWPNRLYMHCAATDLDETGDYPYHEHEKDLPPPDVARPSQLQLAIWDRLAEKDVGAGYYYFSQPITGLFASRKYDAVSHPYEQFTKDAAAGTLPNVTFVDPDFGTVEELTGTSNDFHPHGSVKVADAFLGEVYNTLRRSPQWDRMVFVLTFDEHGGFYDHVPPPLVRDDNRNFGPGPHPDYRRLGFRVPCIAMGPFAPRRVEHAGPYEHCSILRMIEWRWGLKPMHARDRHAKNLADALDFSTRRAPVRTPRVVVPATLPPPDLIRG